MRFFLFLSLLLVSLCAAYFDGPRHALGADSPLFIERRQSHRLHMHLSSKLALQQRLAQQLVVTNTALLSSLTDIQKTISNRAFLPDDKGFYHPQYSDDFQQPTIVDPSFLEADNVIVEKNKDRVVESADDAADGNTAEVVADSIDKNAALGKLDDTAKKLAGIITKEQKEAEKKEEEETDKKGWLKCPMFYRPVAGPHFTNANRDIDKVIKELQEKISQRRLLEDKLSKCKNDISKDITSVHDVEIAALSDEINRHIKKYGHTLEVFRPGMVFRCVSEDLILDSKSNKGAVNADKELDELTLEEKKSGEPKKDEDKKDVDVSVIDADIQSGNDPSVLAPRNYPAMPQSRRATTKAIPEGKTDVERSGSELESVDVAGSELESADVSTSDKIDPVSPFNVHNLGTLPKVSNSGDRSFLKVLQHGQTGKMSGLSLTTFGENN